VSNYAPYGFVYYDQQPGQGGSGGVHLPNVPNTGLFRIGDEVIMVNDNVRYAGASISVDLILSDIAAKIGFQIEEISVLPIGKGNSSQQMGAHGREALRKCVYIWRKK
jgi:methylaspartate ammonia-lyase